MKTGFERERIKKREKGKLFREKQTVEALKGISMEGGVDTTDRLFTLAYADLGNPAYGFSSDRFEEDLNRRCTATAYGGARCQII